MSGSKKKISTTTKKIRSSGEKWYSSKRKEIRRLRMKINRWSRNQSDEQKKQAGKSCKNWNVTGLEKHLNLLEKLVKEGPQKRR